MPLARPAYGQAVTDPDFGTSLRRITNATATGGFATHIYSQLQAFSSDDRYILLIEGDDYTIRRVADLSRVTGLDTSGWNAPRWYPAQAHSIIHFDSNADQTVRVQVTSVDTLQTTTIFTFPSQYRTVFNNQSFDELSVDGRWMAGMVKRDDGRSVMFALDTVNGVLGAVMPVHSLYTGPCKPDAMWGEVEPDWIAASPLGRELVVQWVRDGTTRCSGLEIFDLSTGGFLGRVSPFHDHGDLGILPDGAREFFMSWDYEGNALATSYRLLPGTATESEPVHLQPMDWIAGHLSCRGPDGVCLVTTSVDRSNGWQPLEGELFLQYTDGSVLRLAHHRSSECGYWVQPRGTISRDGRYVVFSSDWGQNGCANGNDLGAGEAYVVDLGADGSPPPPPPSPSPTPLPAPAASCLSRPATLTGTSGDDTLTGTAGPDVIAGLGGNDRVRGAGSDDRLCGNGGSDTLEGGSGNDRLSGGTGSDVCLQGRGTGTLSGCERT